ncbi:MAG: hypothetical protein QG671_3923 [Actinomycetota bacterium]|nr:hypothetical protein [Actinomycetota bacterium]
MSPLLEIVGRTLAFALGAALFFATTTTVVQSMLAPRATHSWLLGLPSKLTRAVYEFFLRRRRTYAARDSLLSTKAPTTILVQLLAVMMSYLIAVTLMLVAVGRAGIWRSLYQAGSALMTLGVVEPANGPAIVISLVAALTGLVVIAILIGYLLTLYAALTARESRMAKLSLIAGEPAWGPEIVARSYLLDDRKLEGMDIEAWIDWSSDVRMAQTSSSVLSHFRSSGPGRSWVISLLAVLDASALYLTTIRGEFEDESSLLRLVAEGSETMAILRVSQSYVSRGRASGRPGAGKLAEITLPTAHAGENAVISAIAADATRAHGTRARKRGVRDAEAAAGITRAEWDVACDVLQRAGVGLVDDLDEAWRTFAFLRAAYAHNAYALADSIYAVRAPWSGTRSPETPTQWPALAVDSTDSEEDGEADPSDADGAAG